MALTWEQLRHSVLLETGVGYGPKDGVYQSSSRTTTAVILPDLANNARVGIETAQLWAFLPDAGTAGDRERPMGRVTPGTGSLANVGAAWSGVDNTPAQVELFRWISPTQMFNQMVSVLREMEQTILAPLGVFEDADCEASGYSAWTAYLGATLSKESTTASLISSGRRSLKIANGTATGGARSPVIPVQPLAPFYLSTAALPYSGTAYLSLYDVTHSAEIAHVTYAGQRYGHMRIEDSIPSGCTQVEVRALGAGASDVIYFDRFHGPYLLNEDLNLYAPSWMNQQYRLRKLRTARYRGGGVDGYQDVEDDRSRTFSDYRMAEDVYFNVVPGDANPYTIQLREAPPSADLWVEGKRSAYDMLSGTPANVADDETIETDLPDYDVILQCSLAVCDYILSNIDPSNAVIKTNGGRIAQLLAGRKSVEPVELPVQSQEIFTEGLGRRV